MMLSDRTSPEPVVPPIEPRVVAMLVGVALLGGFTVAALLFGVVLSGDDTDSIGAGGQTAAIAETTTTIATAAPQVRSDQAAAPLVAQTDESPQTSLAVPAAGSDTSVETSEPSTTTTVATTVPTTPAPTTAATPAPTEATTTTAPPATEAPTTQAPTSTMADPPADPPPPSGGDAVYQQQVLDLTNAERAKNGCGAVILDPTLNAVADAHSEDMAANGYFDHTGRDGSQPWDRVSAAGYPARGSGENIAQGYNSAEAVVAGWMSSPGHRRNILNCEWTELGVGYAEGRGGGNIPGLYWTQVFAIRR